MVQMTRFRKRKNSKFEKSKKEKNREQVFWWLKLINSKKIWISVIYVRVRMRERRKYGYFSRRRCHKISKDAV